MIERALQKRIEDNLFKSFPTTTSGELMTEVDFIEDYDGILHAYEFKYSAKAKVKPPKLFLETYPSEFTVINRDNWYEWLHHRH